jgi:hypothetical protein
MNSFPTKSAFLFVLFIAFSTQSCCAQTPAPALQVQFSLPLADNMLATAMILPAANNTYHLVYATQTGQLVSYQLIPNSPNPIPDPKPVVQSLSVITVTETDQAVVPTAISSFLTSTSSTYYAFTVAMVAEKAPPKNALLWIGRTAGKTLPYSFATSLDGKILWEGPTPIGGTAFLEILQRLVTRSTKITSCTGPFCPLQRGNPR